MTATGFTDPVVVSSSGVGAWGPGSKIARLLWSFEYDGYDSLHAHAGVGLETNLLEILTLWHRNFGANEGPALSFVISKGAPSS